jgi:hypothetical protein
MRADVLGASGVSDVGQINAEDLVRRREADLLRPTTPLELAGDGRINSAMATAMRVARARGD